MNERRIDVDVKEQQSSGKPQRVLLTNDDGVDSPGLAAIAEVLASSYEVLVVAPDGERSGSGTGIGQVDPTSGVDTTPAHVGGVDGYAIAGPPGLAVMSAMLGAFGDPPDLIVSGVNRGINTGHSVIHSGTVGAILTARTFGANGLAISSGPTDPWHFDTAAHLGALCIEWMTRGGHPFTLNLNVPGRSLNEIRGLRWADLDTFGFFRVAMGDVPGKAIQFEVGPPEGGLDPASDSALLREGFATLTPLTTVEPAAYPKEELPEIGDIAEDSLVSDP